MKEQYGNGLNKFLSEKNKSITDDENSFRIHIVDCDLTCSISFSLFSLVSYENNRSLNNVNKQKTCGTFINSHAS